MPGKKIVHARSPRRRSARGMKHHADLVFAGFLLAVAFLALGFSTRVWEAQAEFVRANAASLFVGQ